MSMNEGKISLCGPFHPVAPVQAQVICGQEIKDLIGFKLKLIIFILILNFMYVCTCIYMFAHACMCPQRPKESMRSPGAGVKGSCELTDTGSGKLNSGALLEHQSTFIL